MPDPDAEILASYTSPPYAPHAALTARRVGDSGGRALYLGWYPTPEQAAAIVARVADLAGVQRLTQPLPEGVVMARRGTSIILLNFTEQTQTIEIAGRRAVLASRDVAVVD